jgi:hypothetical protein
MSAGELPESAIKERRTHEGYQRKLEYVRRYKAANRERIAERERPYKAEYYRMKRPAILKARKEDYKARSAVILAAQKAGRERAKAEEAAIAAEMEAMEADAMRVFVPTQEPKPHRAKATNKPRGRATATPGFTIRPDKRARGKSHAETVALRLVARNGPALLPEPDDVGPIMRAARRKRERYGRGENQ